MRPFSVGSSYILGRKKTRAAFKKGKPFLISAYWSHAAGEIRYTDPIGWGCAEIKPSVRYRIRVTPKGPK